VKKSSLPIFILFLLFVFLSTRTQAQDGLMDRDGTIYPQGPKTIMDRDGTIYPLGKNGDVQHRPATSLDGSESMGSLFDRLLTYLSSNPEPKTPSPAPNPAKPAQAKQDTMLRHTQLLLNEKLIISSYDASTKDFNAHKNDHKTCADVISKDLQKINSILSKRDSLNAKQGKLLVDQNMNQIMTGSSQKFITISEADQLISRNNAIISKIQKDAEDISWVDGYNSILSWFQSIINN
jgi:hypothetical protein